MEESVKHEFVRMATSGIVAHLGTFFPIGIIGIIHSKVGFTVEIATQAT